jgi:predicted homoserine dehydrogenase-like protein
MYLYSSLLQRETDGRPVKVGLIGAGKFGSMFLSQLPFTPGLTIEAIADLDPARAQANCSEVGWDEARIAACDFIDDAEQLIRGDKVDVVVEATGHPAAGIRHALLCCEHGKHVVMVNVEADVLAGPYLARQAKQAGIVYSMAYGDQPALTMEMIDWARSCGFKVVAAGKGTKYLPEYHYSTPDTVWSHYGLSAEQAAAAGMRSQMFNSFLDGTKSATGSRFRPAAPTTWPGYCVRPAPAVSSNSTARSRSSPASSATVATWNATCAGACTACSRRPTITAPPASGSTA